MMHITEDTPPDMLTGAMDLTVQLPAHNKPVKMSVERSTPMMDVLVLITTRYNLQVSRYQIEALSLDYSDRVLPYRPNTPLGALETQYIRVIPKQKAAPPPRPVAKGGATHQPFENTFRLKVHLPNNQLYVARVSRNVYLEDIMAKVCDDKNIDYRKYEFRHPGNLDQILDAKLTINDYQITEIYLMIKGTLTTFSTNDIMALRKEEERKQLHTKAGGGVFNLIFKKGRNSLEYGSGSSENQSVSPSQSDDSRSVTPPAIQTPIISLNTNLTKPKDPPKPPLRKRKPAPKPPSSTQPNQPNQLLVQTISPANTTTTTTMIKPSSSTEAIAVDSVSDLPVNNDNVNGVTNICHSRTSSDSSGYHEASILSDNLINNSSLPRAHQRPKTIIGSHEIELRKGNSRGIHSDHSKSTGNLMTLASKSKSTMSLMTTGRKKKAAPLPPNPLPSLTQPSSDQQTQSLIIPSTKQSTTIIPSSTIAAISLEPKEHIIPDVDTSKVDETVDEPNLVISQDVDPAPSAVIESHQTSTKESADISSINQSSIAANEESNTSSYLDQNQVPKTANLNQANPNPKPEPSEPGLDWKYELPLPPTAFRDNSQDNLDNLTQYDTTTLVSERFRGDSVVSNPELFEKLNKLKEIESDTATTASVTSTEDDKSIYNKLSFELLEKRKHLVYNREIATTLKAPELPTRDSFKLELEDAIHNKPVKPKVNNSTPHQSSGLPNFKITTYDEPKSKINIYEDDTISSNQSTMLNNDLSYKTRSLMRNQYESPAVNASAKSYAPVVRSGSFSINTWSAVNPLKRSTSQAALIHRRNEEEAKEATNLSKAISTMDVASTGNAGGLQSLGVMKQIQNSLQSPTTIDTVDSKPIDIDDEIVIRRKPIQKSNDVQIAEEPNLNVAKTIATSNTLPRNNEVKPLKRWSPPSISLGTWNDRPKTEIFVKGDSDYKFKSMHALPGDNNIKNSYKSGGLVVISNNNTNNELTQRNSYKTDFDYQPQFVSRRQPQQMVNGDNNVSIKINGSEPISSSSETGNVTIRIGSTPSSQINYRKPFGTINSIRPHSVAIDTNYDVSRRPVVTSATLKKSITQINNNNNYSAPLKKPDRPTSVYLLNNNNNTTQNTNYNSNNRKSWNALLNQGGLLSSSNEYLSNKATDVSYNTNVNVPFSQMRLKRTDSNKILTQPTANGTEMGFGRVLDKVPSNLSNEVVPKVEKRQQTTTMTSAYCPPPPPPPLLQMPAIQRAPRHQPSAVEDPRSALLNAIQNFGGKKGLRTIRT